MADKKQTARKCLDIITTRTRDQVKAIMDIGQALLQVHNEDLWNELGYRSWADFCERAADLSPGAADRYIHVYITFDGLGIADHEYVGITKLYHICRIAVTKGTARKALKVAKNMSCEQFRIWCARESRRLKKQGYALREMSERTTQVNIVFDPAEKQEFRSILEDVKEAGDHHLYGQAALEMARFWRKHHRKLKKVA